jgi:hypothetical protein
MARLPRICPHGIPQHVIQRGNNGKKSYLIPLIMNGLLIATVHSLSLLSGCERVHFLTWNI